MKLRDRAVILVLIGIIEIGLTRTKPFVDVVEGAHPRIVSLSKNIFVRYESKEINQFASIFDTFNSRRISASSVGRQNVYCSWQNHSLAIFLSGAFNRVFRIFDYIDWTVAGMEIKKKSSVQSWGFARVGDSHCRLDWGWGIWDCTHFDKLRAEPRPLIQVEIIDRGLQGFPSCSLLSLVGPLRFEECIASDPDRIARGFGSPSHLFKLAPVDDGNRRIYQQRGDPDSYELPFPTFYVLLKFFGAALVGLGIWSSWQGWHSARLDRWFGFNIIAVILYWHGASLLLGI